MTQNIASPAGIKRAKDAAERAIAAAYAPQPVPNSGGLHLCAEMRLWRATEILAVTDRSAATYTEIVIAVGKLSDQAEELHSKARQAIADYRTLAPQAESLPIPRCICDGHKMIAAMEDTRLAALALLWPLDTETYPALASLSMAGMDGSAEATQQVNGLLNRLVHAQIAYVDSARRLGVQCQWGMVLR